MCNSKYLISILFFSVVYGLFASQDLQAKNSDPTVITLMVVYTEDAKNWADQNQGGINNIIAQGVAYTNQVMGNSELNVEIKLVHAAMVDYDETGDSRLDLRRLRAENEGDFGGYMLEVHDWRDKYNADLVKLLPLTSDVGGRAYIPSTPAVGTGFSITRVDRANTLTFAHEIGHNLGFHHSRNQQSNPAPPEGGMFEYSTGWRWSGNDGRGYVSVMTYPEGDTRVPYFSNPDVSYRRGATGSYSGKGSPADNTRGLREVKNYIAGYRGPVHKDDSLAVVALYESTDGNNWDNNEYWLTNTPLRNWTGLSNVMWRVFNVNLSNNNLNGTLPPEIGDLEGLQNLSLSHNNLTNSIPSSIGNFNKLQSLYLNNNQFSETMPKSLGNLKELRWLSVGGNQLSGEIPEEVGDLTNLQSLSIQNNQFSGPIPHSIGKLNNLHWLSLHQNELSGNLPESIKYLTKLETIQLQNNQLTGAIPNGIGKLENLRWLAIQGNQITGEIPKEIGNLTKVQTLYFHNNQLEGMVPSEIGSLSNLVRLYLYSNNLRGPLPASLKKLKNLEYFYFHNNFLCLPSDQDFLDWLDSIENMGGTDIMCSEVMPEIADVLSPNHRSEDQALSLLLEWTNAENADWYHLQVSESEGFEDISLDVNVEENSYQLTDLEQKTTYYWRVMASNEYLDSEWSEVWSFTTAEVLPVENVIASVEGSQVTLNWDPIESGLLNSYIVYKGSSSSSLEEYQQLSPDETSFNEQLSEGSTFYAIAANYGEGLTSSITDAFSFYNEGRTIDDSWSLISLPISQSSIELSDSQVFTFNRIYERGNTIEPGIGYWVRSNNGEQISALGEGILDSGINLKSGWNLIGGIADPVSIQSILDPDNILTDAPVYYYYQGSYHQASELEPGIGYWIYAAEEGTIRLEAGAPQVSEKQKKMFVDEASDFYHLHFENEHSTQDFWISEQPLTADQQIRFMLPPKAPEPGLDVRSSAGYAISRQHSDQIEITSTSWPIEVTMTAPENSDPDYIYRITGKNSTDEVHFNLNPGQTIRINSELENLILERVHIDETIQEYFVYPNYPNPFNPITSIQYQLPEQSHVLVDVYNIAGQRVSTLVNQQQQAGMYTIQFDGSYHASGIYFVRFQAGSFSQIQKLTLIK